MQQEGREEARRQKAIGREQEWIASSPKARQAKSKARIRAYDELVDAADERVRATRRSSFRSASGSAQVVIEIENLTKGYGDSC